MADPPPRSPLACGALGRYRLELVAEIARRLGVPMHEAHRDPRSILMLDRPAIPWGRWPGPRGFAWSELPAPGVLSPPQSWEDAATRLRACGLAIDRRRRQLHSSVTGIAPVYYLDRDGATYFASRIDPLVGALGGPLSVDWETWASIFCLGHPVGDGTPFAEVRILRPFELLRRDETRSRVVSPEWPWQRIESALSVAEGVGPMLDALRAGIEPLASRPATSLLSGGLDSRLLLALLVEAGASDVRALTLETAPVETAIATEVARRYGIEHELVSVGGPEGFLGARAAQAAAADFQRVRQLWLGALCAPLRRHRRIALDGLALDALATHSSPDQPRLYTADMFAEPDQSGRTARKLWVRLSQRGMGRAHERVLSPPLAERMAQASRRSFIADSRPLRDHPSQAILLLYRTRTVRGVSSLPHQELGADAVVATPFADDRATRACLAVHPASKHGFRLYDALFAAIDPDIRRVPTTVDAKRDPASAPADPEVLWLRLRRLPEIGDHFARRLRDSSLGSHFSPTLARHLAEGTLTAAFETGGFFRGALAISMFDDWVERYGSLISRIDAADWIESDASSEPASEPTPV